MEPPPRAARSYRSSLSAGAERGSLSWLALQSEASNTCRLTDTSPGVSVVVHLVQTMVEHVISVLESRRTAFHHQTWTMAAHYSFLLIQETTESSGG